jgi:hypothetical protein
VSSYLNRLLRIRGPLQSFAKADAAPSSRKDEGHLALVWTAEEKKSISHFFCALKLGQEASAALAARTAPGQPTITRNDFIDLRGPFWDAITMANDAKYGDLTKAHSELPKAFKKFIRYLELTRYHLIYERIDPEGLPYYQQWEDWFAANKQDIRFPSELPVPRGDKLTNEWARNFSLFQGIRIPKFVPE